MVGMGEVVPARISLTLHPPSPPTVLKVSCLKVSQGIIVLSLHVYRYLASSSQHSYVLNQTTIYTILIYFINDRQSYHIIQICSGITSGRVFDGDSPADWRVIFMKQSVGKCKQINF